MQFVANGIIAAGSCALIATGFSLIYSTGRVLHFTVLGIYAVAAYLFYFARISLAFPLFPAVLLSILAAAVIGAGLDTLVFAPLRRRNVSTLLQMIASLGLLVVIQNLIPLIWGDDMKLMAEGEARPGLLFLGARMTPIQIATVGLGCALPLLFWLLLKWLRLGQQVRAVANDPELCRAMGVNNNQVILFASALGSVSIAVAALLAALGTGLTPTMGFDAFLMGAVAAIVGGVGNMPGALLGALLVGLVTNLASWKVSSEWQEVVAFALLMAFLLVRPRGILGRHSSELKV